MNTIFSSSLHQVTIEKPILIHVLLDHTEVQLQLDTGSRIINIHEHVWGKMGKPKLQPVKMNLNSFTSHSIHLRGEKMVRVKYNHLTTCLRLFVVNGSRSNILGRDWIDALHLNVRTLDDIAFNASVLKVNLDDLFAHYKDFLNSGLSYCKVKAHLHIKSDIIPRFCKPRSLPFAYREAVEADLERLGTEKVLESINVSKWAAPIVVVPKPGGKVRI